MQYFNAIKIANKIQINPNKRFQHLSSSISIVLEKSYFLLSFIFKMKYFSGEKIIKTKILVLLFDENQI